MSPARNGAGLSMVGLAQEMCTGPPYVCELVKCNGFHKFATSSAPRRESS